MDAETLLTAQVFIHAMSRGNTSNLLVYQSQDGVVCTGVQTVELVLSYKTPRYSYYNVRRKPMPTITYMTIEQAEEEIRQREVTERIRRFATSDPEVAKQREAEGWGKSKPKEVLDK